MGLVKIQESISLGQLNLAAQKYKGISEEMSVKEAVGITGGLSKPSKMPTASYGLPISSCKMGSKLRKLEGTICSKCYAGKGFYKTYQKTILPVQTKRLNSLTHENWVPAMIKLISKQSKVFRWHDSGDIQSKEHLANIVTIALALPNIKFWVPTREQHLVANWIKEVGPFPDNLIIRVSAVSIDGVPPIQITGYASTVHTNGVIPSVKECRAYTREGHCGNCRACWSSKIESVSYPLH